VLYIYIYILTGEINKRICQVAWISRIKARCVGCIIGSIVV